VVRNLASSSILRLKQLERIVVSSSKFKKRFDWTALGQSIASFFLLSCVVYFCFGVYSHVIASVGFALTDPQQFALWYGIGLAGAAFWPIWFRDGMEGHWVSAFRWMPFLALSGPLAFILGFPL